MDIKGICPIAPAVFDDHGNLDLTSYADCCRRLIALGAQALTLFGIAGEYYKLDADEERSLIDVTVRTCHEEGVPAIVSNTRHATETACRWARHIEAAGADCMMLLPPFFLKPAGAALLSHLDAVCSAVSIPVTPVTEGLKPLTLAISQSPSHSKILKRCEVIFTLSTVWGPRLSGVTFSLPSPTTRTFR